MSPPTPRVSDWVALLAVDVTQWGVVMSADSQQVEIRGGENRTVSTPGWQARDPILPRVGGGFVGLVGFAGTEEVESLVTAEWLRQFVSHTSTDDVESFCRRLGARLTDVWRDGQLETVLEILVAGEVGGDVQFWYVRNSAGLRADGFHNPPAEQFAVENDLDRNYVPKDTRPGESKDQLLARVAYSFRQGVLVPASPVFDGFTSVLTTLYVHHLAGFVPVASLDDVGQFARVRMEFLKRLCTSSYGIYAEGVPTPIGGVVHVYGVGRDGVVREYVKKRRDVRELRAGRRTTAT